MSYCSNLTWSFAKIWCTIFFFFFFNFWIDWDCYSSQCIKSETKTCCVGKIQESVCSCMIYTLLLLSVGFDMYWCCFQRFGYSTSMLLLLLLRMNRWIWLLIMIYQPIHMIMFIVLVELLGIDVFFFSDWIELDDLVSRCLLSLNTMLHCWRTLRRRLASKWLNNKESKKMMSC